MRHGCNLVGARRILKRTSYNHGEIRETHPPFSGGTVYHGPSARIRATGADANGPAGQGVWVVGVKIRRARYGGLVDRPRKPRRTGGDSAEPPGGGFAPIPPGGSHDPPHCWPIELARRYR